MTIKPDISEITCKISFARIDQLNRSALVLLAERLHPNCPSWNKPVSELPTPEKLVAEITSNCKADDNYINTDMPIKEMIFRILLTSKNKPRTIGNLHKLLTGTWSTPIKPITLSQASLIKVIEQDDYYGFELSD
tara:strand:+ start:27232 stop:27636 length:405 start_codon:yes stop_codon:yes gene_type:complete